MMLQPIGSKCFLLTARGQLMPASYAGPVLIKGLWLESVHSASNPEKTYTCKIENVISAEAGREMQIRTRGENLLRDGYIVSLQFSPRGPRFRVYNPLRHGLTGGYILTQIAPGKFACTCPYFPSHGDCKHSEGLPGLLHARAHAAQLAGKPRHAETFHGLAIGAFLTPSEIVPAAPSAPGARVLSAAQFAANVLRDFA